MVHVYQEGILFYYLFKTFRTVRKLRIEIVHEGTSADSIFKADESISMYSKLLYVIRLVLYHLYVNN